MIKLNTIYNENCLDTMFNMPDKYIDLTVTSPPYDGLRTYDGYSFDFENTAKELFRITKTGGVVVWVVGDSVIKGSESGTSFKQALFFMKCGFRLHDTMIYQKINYVPLNHQRYEQCWEYMFVLSKGKPKTFNPIMIPCKFPGKPESYGAGRRQNFGNNHSMRTYESRVCKQTKETKIAPNIFSYVCGSEKSGHPAPFPNKLAEDHILSWSNKGDIVYDPFAGSGTVPKICEVNSRNWIASEISAGYCKIINSRLLI